MISGLPLRGARDIGGISAACVEYLLTLWPFRFVLKLMSSSAPTVPASDPK
jgi:hypothetical protein